MFRLGLKLPALAVLSHAGSGGGGAAPSFDPTFEYCPDPGFDNPAAWSAVRCVVSGSALAATSNTSPSATATPAGTLVPGTYRCVYSVPVAFVVGFPGVYVGGTLVNDTSRAAGVHSQDIVVSSVGSQSVGFFFNSSNNGKSITDLSIKRIA